jgi:hypothetical protein
MILVRIALICLIVYLITRSFVKYAGGENQQGSATKESEKNDKSQQKKISKDVGEYVDFEELKKK